MPKLRKLQRLLLVCVVVILCLSSCSGGSIGKSRFNQLNNVTSVNQISGLALSVSPPAPMPSKMPSNSSLILVNKWNPISDDYAVDLKELPNHQRVAAVCYADLMLMLSDCKNVGLNPMVCSGYRTQKDQTTLFNNKVARVMEQEYEQQTAELLAATEVAYPGTSEHHTGLAVDIVDRDYPVLDASQEARPTQQWLMENCWKYGFILRYPSDKTTVTGIIYEPWHYRYVGREVAEEIYKQGICLEEYLQ